MAVDSAFLYNNAWVYLRASGGMGVNYGGASDKQKHNAELFYNLLRVFGYTHSYSQLPNGGEHVGDLTNNALLNWTTGAIGLIQWRGASSIDGYAQIPSFANRYSLLWYNWEIQLFRLEMEYIYDPTGWDGVNGVRYNFWYPATGTASITWKNYKLYTIFRILVVKDFLSLYGKEKLRDKKLMEHFINCQINWYYSNKPTHIIVQQLRRKQYFYLNFIKTNIQYFAI